MEVNGYVRMSITMNVIGLETDAAEVSDYGKVNIVDDDQFFMDWVDAWSNGEGELLGASIEHAEIEEV